MAQKWVLKLNKSAAKEVKARVNQGLFLASEYILEMSNRVVPIDETTLERSGVASQDPSKLMAAVSYDTPYAVVQHENLSMRHDPGRTAKFLENTANAEASTVAKLIADTIRKG